MSKIHKMDLFFWKLNIWTICHRWSLKRPNFEMSNNLVIHVGLHQCSTSVPKGKITVVPQQPGYNFWLSVQVFSCPYLDYINMQVQRWVLATDLLLSIGQLGQLHQYFELSSDFFGCLGRTDNQNFECWCVPFWYNIWCNFVSTVAYSSLYKL